MEIWLVNDDPAQLLVQKRLLGRFAATVWDFQSATELIAQARKYGSCPNLVSDYHMPEINGLQLSQMWCELHPNARVLLLSASRLSESEAEELTYLPSHHVKVLTDFRLPDLLTCAREWFTTSPSPAQDKFEGSNTPNSYRFFNTEMLSKLCSLGGNSFVRKAIERFADRVPSRLDSLVLALKNDRSADVMAEAHSLKGSCGVVGAFTMMEIAGRLEDLAQADTPPSEMEGAVSDLKLAWEGTKQEIRTIINDLCG